MTIDYRASGRIEQLMVSAILLFGLFILIGSFQFSGPASQFPQITSGIVLVTGLLLLVQNHLSDSTKAEESIGERITDVPEEISESQDQVDTSEDEQFNIDELYSILLITSYVIGGILIGLLWVTPAFVITYARWQGLNWKRAISLSGLSVLIPFIIMYYLNIDYSTGILTGGF